LPFCLLILVAGSTAINAQTVDSTLIRVYEDSLKVMAFEMMNNPDSAVRVAAKNEFMPLLREALDVPGAFNYDFDSLVTVSRLRPEDGSFRLMTWQLCLNSNLFEYYGFLQMPGEGGRIFRLYDKGDEARIPEKDILSNKNWMGALYYNIKEFKDKKTNYYLLFGFDATDLYTRTKLIDVLSFEKGKPVFGAPVFIQEEPSGMQLTQNRFIITYGAGSAVSLNYNQDLEMIVFDNLISIGSQYEDQGIIGVGDGSYRGFTFKKGKWHTIEKVFTYVQEEAPRPNPILDNRKGRSGLIGPDNN
ncbi:MAG: hypothetical protein AAFV80_20330, partial [Bacteroidota bacterium]